MSGPGVGDEQSRAKTRSEEQGRAILNRDGSVGPTEEYYFLQTLGGLQQRPCGYLGEEWSRQREQLRQRPRGRHVLGVLRE